MDLISRLDADDALLLQRMRNNDRAAFNTLFERYWAGMYEKAFRRLKDPFAAKDIVQDIFVYIWVNRRQEIANLPAYLHVSVRNRVLQSLRSKKNKEAFLDPADRIFGNLLSNDPSALQRKEFYHSFEKLVSSLPPKRQQIFRLRYSEELNTRDIAMKMGLTQKTVQNQLGKAVEKLRVALLQLFLGGALFVTTAFF
ncbi:MAG: sigma-70 family RNA polymerase sigma factor [Flavihumibacter sp.]